MRLSFREKLGERGGRGGDGQPGETGGELGSQGVEVLERSICKSFALGEMVEGETVAHLIWSFG